MDIDTVISCALAAYIVVAATVPFAMMLELVVSGITKSNLLSDTKDWLLISSVVYVPVFFYILFCNL